MGKLRHKQLLAMYRLSYLYWVVSENSLEVCEICVVHGQYAVLHAQK